MTSENHTVEAAMDEGIGRIAVIGMSGRFPGAPSVDALWEMVSRGGNAFTRFRPEELEDAFDDEVRASKEYVPARPYLEDVELFDAEFFGMYPREAALIDPQFRIFLEICWEAIEQAGYDPTSCPGHVGVFGGSALGTYLINNILSSREKAEAFTSNYQVGMFSELVGSINDTLATRIAYKLNLRGPAFTIQSACSTSLLAVSQACQNLLTYSCDMALAGGVSITFPQKRGYIYQEGGMVSPDGCCRPFDADAAGTVFGSGAGVVLLKRLDDALRDGDYIHAVILGYGVNNDGSGKVGYTAPSVAGQAEVISAAHASAGIEPSTIGFIEGHGTATPLGDPIEFAGLREAFASVPGQGVCALGSVKGNLGHLDAAAGVTGLIKAVLALRHAKIPPLANFSAPNPRIDVENSPFYIPRSLQDWPSQDHPRRAGVSSFGVGGTNVHIVLEEAPSAPPAATLDEKFNYIIPLSARTESSLAIMRRNLAQALRSAPDLALPSVAFTLQNGRAHFAHRTAVIVRNVEEAVAGLESERPLAGKAADAVPPVIFMFPGQGAQYVGMGAGLYETEPEFARWIDHGTRLLEERAGIDLRKFLCRTGEAGKEMSAALRDTRITQPALYLVEYATARLWMSRGLKPDAMIGHSVGEFVAATLADVMSFDDALLLVTARGRLMQKQPRGAMVSVRAEAATVQSYLGDGIEIAAVNAPKLCVISGTFEAADAACARLEAAGIAFSRLHTSHAFHSAMMDEAAVALREMTGRIAYGKASIPYISCVTGDWQTDSVGTSPDYWARHCRDAVRFADGLKTACRDRKPVLLEVGPGRTLSTFAAQTIDRSDVAAIVQSLPEHDRAEASAEVLAEAHARLWIAGCDLEWPSLPATARRRLPLPTYAFDRQRHWVEAPPPLGRSAKKLSPATMIEAAPPGGAPAPALAYGTETMNVVAALPSASRIQKLETSLLALLTEMSGEELAPDAAGATFLELGFDSLFIGQFAQRIEKEYKVKLSFRELLSNIPSVTALAEHLDKAMPPEVAQKVAASVQAPVATIPAPSPQMAPSAAPATVAGLDAIFQSQMQMMQQLFAQQLQTMQALSGGAPVQAPPAPQQPAPLAAPGPVKPTEQAVPTGDAEIGSGRIRLYKPGVRVNDGELTPEKRKFIADLTERYAAKNARSKAFTAANRRQLADPRTAAGFRPEWKELVFPVVSDRSKGSRIWDIDGNEYIDLVNGMGQTAFGHAPDFVVNAIIEQVNNGFAIGPQTPLAGEVADLISEMTGHERVTFCNTGSEAVMAAMRVARTVTGRERVVVFGNDYHGQFDEVLVKGRNRAGAPLALPIAAGIPHSSVSNMTVLAYGAPESLDWIRANAKDLAAVIIEPVQSRHPELRPADFVRELRRIADEGDFALVFDEVVTGFRVHPGGMQAVWGIKADMATYGKVLGGGMPIGVLAGHSRFMDALDGGHWNYGDDSVPMVAPTFFAGTFVRHPVVLAAAKAVLKHIKGEGQALYSRVADRTRQLVEELNEDLAQRGIAGRINTYASWFVTDFGSLDPLGALFYPHARLQGVHIQDGYPCFLTTAHSEEDVQRVAAVFRESLDALQSVGILAPSVDRPVRSVEKPALAEAASQPKVTSAELTESQKEIWLAAQAGDEASCSFNESFSLTLEGALNKDVFRRALDMVVARHDALHIRFSRSGDRFEMIPDFRIAVEEVDLRGDPAGQGALDNITAEEASTPFDLVNGPLVRARLVLLAEDRLVFVFTAHHIVCDGWSVNVILEELATAYSALLAGKTPDLPPALSFATYASTAKTEASPATEEYWLKQFEIIPDLPDMPTDRPRPEQRTFAGGTCTAHIKKDTYRRLKKAGAKSGATLFSTLLAALQVMVTRLSGSTDIVIAVPSAGQSLLPDQTLVGHCVNLLPIRQQVNVKATFEEHLRETQQLVLQAFEHQDYTYGTLVRKLGLKRDPSRLPLTEIQFNLERVARNVGFSGLSARVAPNPKAFSNFDMFLNMIEGDDGIRIDVDYNADVFDRSTIERWLGHFDTLVTALAEGLGRKIVDLPLLSPAEMHWLVDELNQTAADYERDRFMFDLFAAKAAEQPDAVAAIHDDTAITYAALEARSNQLARHIRTKLVIPGLRIALALDRSIDMLVALLAIMKAGHAYIPLDPSHPEARLKQTMETARISAIICASDTIANLAGSGTSVIRMDLEQEEIERQDTHPLEPQVFDTEAPAYVIFTSGSTGTPKGVEVSHRALVNFLCSMALEPGFTPQDTLLAVTTISFDIAGLELYLPLITGGKVVIANRTEVQDGFALVKLLETSGATVLQATPTLWQMLVEAGLGNHPGLKMLCGGEPLPKELAKTLLRLGGELWNMYGPTETTIWSSLARIENGDAPIHIGHPIANTQLYILDAYDQVAPVGVTGELYIGGDGLANGYFDRLDLTEAAFRQIRIDESPSRRLYKTGDVGRRLPDGTLQLLGRRDSQIKLRGFRIELGEIEAVIGKKAGIRQCAVVAAQNKNGDRQLVCHFVPDGPEPSPEELTSHAKAHLPAHMVPSFWVATADLPRTANGKLDRKALEKLGVPQRQEAPVRTRPLTPMEEKLSSIWKEVLQIGDIGVDDNLYALGADSLSIFRIAARMMDAGLPLEAKHLMRHPTISDLAGFAEEQGQAQINGSAHIPSLRDFRHGARRRLERLT